jgi:tetratricopeptide (TPR) repeat protein
MVSGSDYAVDFFVSHADVDVQWAEWIAAELENAGYGVIVKAWDFRPGEDLLTRHDEALAACRHTVCVLSSAYVESEVAARTAALRQGLEGKQRALIPVRVADCTAPPLMGSIIPIDLSGVDDEDEARQRLLAGVADRVDRLPRSGYPGAAATRVRFPGIQHEVWELRGHRPDRYFTGRDDELETLYRALRGGSPTAAIQVITGLGGIGKSRLAVEYAFRYGTAYDLVWWIRAEDQATLRSDYVELAQALGLPSGQDDQAVAALRQELRRQRDWLLIFDNAEEPDDLFRLLPDRHPGHVLITTRRREWPHAETRNLGVLPARAAVEYLQRRGKVADAGTAGELADALGRLPLALAQAASVIADGMPASDYLGLLREQSPELFAEGRTEDHHMTIDSTWRVSVDRLARRSPGAVALFRLAAFLNADAIPLARLRASTGMPAELADALSSPFQLSKATGALGEYSLAETGDGLLSIHRMVQAVTRTELGGDEPYWASIALTTIAAAFPRDVRDPKTWDACEAVLTHALTSAEHARRLDTDAAVTVQLLNRVAIYLLARGRIDLAGSAITQALTLAEHSPQDDPTYLSCRSTYGQVVLARGDIPAARVIHEEIYKARTRILGPEDPDTLRAGRDLVEALFLQGYPTDAAQLQDQLVEAFTSVLGADDLETITSLAYQATLLRDAGQYARARAIEEQVVEARTRVLGPEHPETLTARGNLAATLDGLGEFGKARAIQEQVVEDTSRVLGPEHPGTLTARSSLAAALGRLGEFGKARAIQEQVVEDRSRVLGPEHPETLTARSNLATALGRLGELGKARAIKEQVVEDRSRVLGPEHPETLRARGNLAATLDGLGEFGKARAIQEQVMEATSRVLGPEHPETLRARSNLAATLGNLGELGKARAIQEQVVEATIRVLGPEHTDTLTARGNLAAMLGNLGELGKARAIQEQVVEDRSRVLGPEHPETLTARRSLARIFYAQGNKSQASSLLAESLVISLRIYGKQHSSSSEIAWQLAESCGPHEANKRRAIIMENLSWLSTQRSDQLTAQQKKIKNGLKGSIHGGKKGGHKPKKRRK